MPWSRPPLQDILNRVAEDIHTKMTKAGEGLRRQCEQLFARALAAESHSLHGYIQDAVKQSVPSLADDDAIILEWARTMLPVPRKQPTVAKGSVYFTGVDGSVIPAGREMSLLLKAESRFVTTAPATIAGGVAIIPVDSASPGSVGNAPMGSKVVLTLAISGVVSTGTVLSPGVTGGFDLESIESVQDRVVHRFRNPPRAGDPADFEAWAREVPGVDKAWGIPYIYGLGTIGVAIVQKHTTLQGWIAPDGPLLAAAQAHINEVAPSWMRDRPVIAPALVPVNFDIQLRPDTPEVRAAVEAELRDLLLREADLGGQEWDRPQYSDPRPPSVIPLSHVREAISTATGETDHVLVAPVTDLVAQAFELVVPGTFSFSSM